MHSQAKSDNEIYLLIKYIKSVLWRAAKRLSYLEDARCLKVKSVWYTQLFYEWSKLSFCAEIPMTAHNVSERVH